MVDKNYTSEDVKARRIENRKEIEDYIQLDIVQIMTAVLEHVSLLLVQGENENK